MKYTPDYPEAEDAALDALLAEARWPEPDAESTRRLARFYRSQSFGRSVRRWLMTASVLLVCGIGAVFVGRATRGPSAPPVQVVNRPSLPEAAPLDVVKVTSLPGRAPTALELARLTVAERDKTRPVPPAPRPSAVERAVAMVVKDGSSNSVAAASELLRKTELARVRRELYAIAVSADRVRSSAAAELIGSQATADSIPLLLQLDRVPPARDAAVRALARLAGPSMLADLARSHPEPVDRRRFVVALLRTPQGASRYLDLVNDRSISKGVLAALDSIDSPMTEPFFAALRDPHVSVRLAAAKALGRIDGPVTTARLVTLTERNDCRREALIALADSRGPEAKQFLQQAGVCGPLAGAVRSILIDPSTHE